MDVKKAVRAAKAYIIDLIIDLYADESIENVGLEEVKFHDQSAAWEITIGFY